MKLHEWADLAEVVASIAVVVTLIVLVFEVRANTAAIERDALLERSNRLSAPFLNTADLSRISAKIQAVDGVDPVIQAFVDHYGLSVAEADRWTRVLTLVWQSLLADYQYNGPSENLAATIRGLISTADNQLFWTHRRSDLRHNDAFNAYVERVRKDR